jgi:hypothetical protein
MEIRQLYSRIYSRIYSRFYSQRFNRLNALRSIMLGIGCLSLVGFVGMPKLPDASALLPPAQIVDVKTAQAAWRASQVAKYSKIWINESAANGDPYRAGKAAYYLALATFEPEWSKAAITAFDKALSTESDSLYRARAGLGASHRLAARDFPITGAAQYLLLGIPGWKRTYHVLTSFSHLNSAVEAAPDDPFIRLSRAAAFVGIPKFFGGREKGIADYEKLEQWTNNPSSNSTYSAFLSSNEWRDEYYLMRAESMQQLGNDQEAVKAWQVLSDEAEDIQLKVLATYKSVLF